MVLKSPFSLHKDSLKLVLKEGSRNEYDIKFTFDTKKACEINIYLGANVKITDKNQQMGAFQMVTSFGSDNSNKKNQQTVLI
jgi:hypothetical protein